MNLMFSRDAQPAVSEVMSLLAAGLISSKKQFFSLKTPPFEIDFRKISSASKPRSFVFDLQKTIFIMEKLGSWLAALSGASTS